MISPKALCEWLNLDTEKSPSVLLRNAFAARFPSCVSRAVVASREVIQCLQTLHSYMDLKAQNPKMGMWVQIALQSLAKEPKKLEALTQLIDGNKAIDNLRTLADGTACRTLFHALQGFLFCQRNQEEHVRLASAAQDIRQDLYEMGIENPSLPFEETAEKLGLRAEQMEQRCNWYAHGGLGIQATAFLSAIKVAKHLKNGVNEAAFKDETDSAKCFKLGPKTIEALFTNPAAITRWLPHDANAKQIVKELQRRADDQFPPPPRTPAAS
jgi:hypothetical protein